MTYTIELEKLTKEQLEAFKVIDKKAFEAETERRLRSTYTNEDIKAGKIYTDLYKAYFYLKPMYDNMRNTDVKKTITQSEVLPIIEKVLRWADSNGVAYEKFKGETIVANISVPLTTGEPVTLIDTAKEVPAANGPADISPVNISIDPNISSIVVDSNETPVHINVAAPTWEPGGGAEVEQPTPVEELSPIESMTQQKLNEILATIPNVEKI